MFIEYRDLEKLKNSTENFLNLFRQRISGFENVERGITLLKRTGIDVDTRGTRILSPLLKSSLNILLEQFPRSKSTIKRYVLEISLLNAFYFRFFEVRRESGVESLDPGEQIELVLVVVELLLGKIRLKFGDNDYQSSIIHLFESLEPYTKNSIAGLGDLDIEGLTDTWERHVSSVSGIFKHLQFLDCPIKLTTPRNSLDASKVATASRHFALYSTFQDIHAIHDEWRFYDVRVHSFLGLHYFRNYEINRFVGHNIEGMRFIHSIRQNQFQAANLFRNGARVKMGTALPPKQYLYEDELISFVDCESYLHVDDLSVATFEGVPVVEWLRSYYVVRRLTEQFRSKARKVLFLRISKEHLSIELGRYGIPKRNAGTIISRLTYDKHVSIDLLDAPLVKDERGYLVLVPNLVSSINVSLAFFSNMLANDVDLSIRGPAFENKLILLLQRAGAKASGLYRKEKGEEYQCDVVAAIGNDLFFFECKAFVQPRSIRSHYDHTKKLEEAAVQLNRIANFFSEQIVLVGTKLKLPKGWKPSTIHRIVLTSSMVSSLLESHGCQIADYSAVSRYLRRDPVGKTGNKNGRVVDPKFKKFFDGPISGSKLIEYIKKTPQTETIRRISRVRHLRADIFGIQVVKKALLKELPSAYVE